jgi:hypothetical protein
LSSGDNLDEFLIYFNKKKQWIKVTLWDVHPNTFANWKAGRWGYFLATYEHPKQGLFGEVHLVKSRVREDLVVHELDHVRTEWMWANGETITRKNEERFTEFLDQLVGKFYIEYRKIVKRRNYARQ